MPTRLEKLIEILRLKFKILTSWAYVVTYGCIAGSIGSCCANSVTLRTSKSLTGSSYEDLIYVPENSLPTLIKLVKEHMVPTMLYKLSAKES